MVFACQNDSFKRTFTSTVRSCIKLKNEDLYTVTCDDTILFPEGGGQPSDTGFLNDVRVLKVLRKGDEAVMYVKSPLKVGQSVTQTIDWDRRLDHMQQHSGQHLITAVINAEYGIETTSWWLGEKVSHIELNIKSLTETQLLNIEKLANEKIFQQTPVVVKLCELGDKALDTARTRGLPSDVTGPIRVVEIVGLEDDMCCGTHVNNLAQLQCIKLLRAEKGKRHKTNLIFLSGGRVLQHFSDYLQREVKLTKLLRNEPSSHPELVEKLQQNLKSTKKKLSTVLRELGGLEAKEFLTLDPKPEYFCRYNKDGDTEYLDSFVRVLVDSGIKDIFFVLAIGEERGYGNLVLLGTDEDLRELAPHIAEMLEGKGAIHFNRYNGKVSKLSNFYKVESAVENYFERKAKLGK